VAGTSKSFCLSSQTDYDISPRSGIWWRVCLFTTYAGDCFHARKKEKARLPVLQSSTKLLIHCSFCSGASWRLSVFFPGTRDPQRPLIDTAPGRRSAIVKPGSNNLLAGSSGASPFPTESRWCKLVLHSIHDGSVKRWV